MEITQTLPRPMSGFATKREAWLHLQRFLIAGSETGVYEPQLVSIPQLGLDGVRACVQEDGARAVELAMLAAARSTRREPALMVLALAASPAITEPPARAIALAALNTVAETGRHLLAFASYVRQTRGWGRALRSAIADWYLGRSVLDLAKDFASGQSWGRWIHRDLIRLVHPKAESPGHHSVLQWAVTGELDAALVASSGYRDLRPLVGVNRLRTTRHAGDAAQIIEEHRLAASMVAEEWKRDPQVWEALIQTMQYTELVENVPAMVAAGLLDRAGEFTALTLHRIADETAIGASGIEPMAIAEVRSSLPAGCPAMVLDALDQAFDAALGKQEAGATRLSISLDTKSALARVLARASNASTGRAEASVVGSELAASATADGAKLIVVGEGSAELINHQNPRHLAIRAASRHAAEAITAFAAV